MRVRSLKTIIVATQLLIILYLVSEDFSSQAQTAANKQRIILVTANGSGSGYQTPQVPQSVSDSGNVPSQQAVFSQALLTGQSQAAMTMYRGSHHYEIEDPFPGLMLPIGDVSAEERTYMRIRYTPPPITGIQYPGHKMKVPADYGREVAESCNHLTQMASERMEQFVFITAASSNHFEESKDAVASMQTQFPGTPIIYFDLGLEPAEIEELKRWDSVQYRWFNFSKYPGQFLINIRRAAWKPFIIMEALNEYGSVFYMDSSIRLMTHDLSPALQLAFQNGGFVLFHNSKYSIYGGTHEKLYTYFPTKKTSMKTMSMSAGGAILVYNTEPVYRDLLWWWAMCTLDKQCYIPTLEMNCDMHTYDKWKDYMHCHKFDTSILSILLSNLHGYDSNKYVAPDGIIAIEKTPTHHFRLKFKS